MRAIEAASSAAFNLLLSLEESVLRNGGALPKVVDATDQWSGVRCVVGGKNYVLPLNQVAEILEQRSITPIPGCAGWIKGLMNVRGRLLPVFDVNEFFNGGRSRNGFCQIILVEHGAMFCGIAVDKVVGMQKFFQSSFTTQEGLQDEVPAGIDAYTGAFTVVDGDRWYQLDAFGLAARMSQANPAAAPASDGKADAPGTHYAHATVGASVAPAEIAMS